MLNPEMSFIKDIIMNENLEDLRYLYFSGEYVTDNEVKTAKYLNSLPQEKIDSIASYFYTGYHQRLQSLQHGYVRQENSQYQIPARL